jgi:hypothetical protein
MIPMKQSSLSAKIRRLAQHAARLEKAVPEHESARWHFKGKNAGFRYALLYPMGTVRQTREKVQTTANIWWNRFDFENYHYFAGVAAALTEVIGLAALAIYERRRKAPDRDKLGPCAD